MKVSFVRAVCSVVLHNCTQQRIYSPQLALPPLLFTLEDEIEDEDDDDCEDDHDSRAETKDIFHLNISIRAVNEHSRSFTVPREGPFCKKQSNKTILWCVPILRSPVDNFALLNMVSSLNKYKYPHLHAGKLKSAAMCYHRHHPAVAPD